MKWLKDIRGLDLVTFIIGFLTSIILLFFVFLGVFNKGDL